MTELHWLICLFVLSSLPADLQPYKINVKSINLVQHLVSGFSQIRHHSKPEYKQPTREYIENYMKKVLPKELHIKQNYNEDISGKQVEGVNYITIIPGPNVGQDDEKILVLLASYDTGTSSPGVNHGGSGSTLLLEVARILGDIWSSGSHVCQRANTVIIAFLDHQENNLGSHNFVEKWLVPKILERHGEDDDVISGIINFGSLLNFDDDPGSQDWPFWTEHPEISQSFTKNNFRGDFISSISRPGDESLEQFFKAMWKKVVNLKSGFQKFKYFPIRSTSSISNHSRHIFQGNHEPFWNLDGSIYQKGFKAMTITDTGNLRGYMRKCLHKKCDDLDHVTDAGAAQWKVVTEVIARSTVAMETDDLELKCFSKTFHDHRTTKGRNVAMHSEDEL